MPWLNAEGFETLHPSKNGFCISPGPFPKKFCSDFYKRTFVVLISPKVLQNSRNTALLCGVSTVYLFCLHILNLGFNLDIFQW